jgi:hypothetical protein
LYFIVFNASSHSMWLLFFIIKTFLLK